MPVNVNVTGLDDVRKALQTVRWDLQENAIRAAMRATARELYKDLKPATPRAPDTAKDTVHIQDHLFYTRSRSQSKPNHEVFVAGVKLGKTQRPVGGKKSKTFKTEGAAFYWKFLEFGTKKMTKRPFLGPTFENNSNRLANLFVKNLITGVDRLKKRLGKRALARSVP